MRIWLPLAILLSVVWLLAVSALVSRGGDGAGPGTPLAGDAAAFLRQSQAVMLELDSLQLQMTTQWEGREYTYRVAWQSPDRFHVLSPYVVARMQTGQGTQISDYGFVEAVAIGERTYARQCADEDEDCQPWEENAGDAAYMPGFMGEFDPFWTFELLSLVSDAHVVGQEAVEAVACTRIRGTANVMEAMIESWRRAEEIRGPLYWGQDCTGEPAEAGGETEERCHALTLDEYIAMRENPVPEKEYESSPLPVELWIGVHDGRMRRFELLQGAPIEGFVAASFTFSQFDEVTVEPPR